MLKLFYGPHQKYSTTLAHSTYVLLLLSAVATFIQTIQPLYSAFSRWTTVEQVMRDSILFPSLIAAIFSAVLFHIFSPQSVIVGRLSSRSAFSSVLQYTKALLISTLSGYILGILPLIIKTALTARWSSLNLLSVISAIAQITMLISISTLVSLLITSRWSLIASPLFTLACAMLPLIINNSVLTNTGHSALTFAPVWLNDLPNLGFVTTPTAHITRLLIPIFMCIAFSRFAAHYLAGEHAKKYLQDAIFDSASLCTVLLIAWSLIVPTTIFAPQHVELQCTSGNHNVTICAHPADTNVRSEINTTIQHIFTVTPQKEQVIFIEGMTADSTVQMNKKMYAPKQILTMRNAVISTLLGNETKTQLRKTITSDLIEQVVAPTTQCMATSDSTAQNKILEIQTALQIRNGLDPNSLQVDETTGKEVLSPDTIWLIHLSQSKLKDWYIAHRNEIQSCTITSIK